VLAPRYFEVARALLRPGELIYVSTIPRHAPGDRTEPGEPRMALVMVRADPRGPERADGAVRLVQDFGRADDAPGILASRAPAAADAAPAPVKRGRGRPPGSRNKKPA
jgi:hypothetical protein